MALTLDQKSELHEWRARGWTLQALGYAFGIAASSVHYGLKKSGGDPLPNGSTRGPRPRPPKPPKPPKIRTERAAELRSWRSRGWTLRALGYAFGISRERVRQLLNGHDPKPDTPAVPRPGTVYGLLTVLRDGDRSKDGHRRIWCRCECGNVVKVNPYTLIRGRSYSCGCVQRPGNRCLRFITIDGRTQHLSAWLREFGLNPRTFYIRVAAGWTDAEALTRPRQEGRRLDGCEKRKGGTNAD